MSKKKLTDVYRLKRKIQRETRDIRKKALGIEDAHNDTSLQRTYGEGTKTKRALKVEIFGSKSKASATEGEETSIEAFVREWLEKEGIKFIEQKAIRFINVDFFLPETKQVIQVHGCYWHCCSECYPAGPKNKTQKKNIEKDRQANSIIEHSGYQLIEIWEHEIKQDKSVILERLKREIMASYD